MTKRKRVVQETVHEPDSTVIIEQASARTSGLKAKLEEIKKLQGVKGYISRDRTSAIVDLEDQTKMTEYALFSSLIFDVSRDLSETFNLGEVKDAIVDGADIRILSTNIDGNKVSIFVNKDVEYEKILAQLREI